MSNEHEHTEHGEHAEGAVHVHVHSLQLYIGIFLALVVLTVITVAASWVDIDGFVRPGTPHGTGGINFALAMAIATVKASLVVLWFMHLKDDARFNALFFLGSLLFVGVFFVYTFNDLGYRQHEDPYQGVHVHPNTGEVAPGGQLANGQPCTRSTAGGPVPVHSWCRSYHCGADGNCGDRPAHEDGHGVGGEHGDADSHAEADGAHGEATAH